MCAWFLLCVYKKLSQYRVGAGLQLSGTHVAGFFCALDQDRAAQRVVASLTALDISDAEVVGTSTAAIVDLVTLLLRTAVSLRSFSALGLQNMAGKRSTQKLLGLTFPHLLLTAEPDLGKISAEKPSDVFMRLQTGPGMVSRIRTAASGASGDAEHR